MQHCYIYNFYASHSFIGPYSNCLYILLAIAGSWSRIWVSTRPTNPKGRGRRTKGPQLQLWARPPRARPRRKKLGRLPKASLLPRLLWSDHQRVKHPRPQLRLNPSQPSLLRQNQSVARPPKHRWVMQINLNLSFMLSWYISTYFWWTQHILLMFAWSQHFAHAWVYLLNPSTGFEMTACSFVGQPMWKTTWLDFHWQICVLQSLGDKSLYNAHVNPIPYTCGDSHSWPRFQVLYHPKEREKSVWGTAGFHNWYIMQKLDWKPILIWPFVFEPDLQFKLRRKKTIPSQLEHARCLTESQTARMEIQPWGCLDPMSKWIQTGFGLNYVVGRLFI